MGTGDMNVENSDLELDWKPIADETGSTEKLLVTIRDVTELKRLQAEAQQQKKELEMIGPVLMDISLKPRSNSHVFEKKHLDSLDY